MSMNFKDDINEDAKSMLRKMFDVDVMDDRTALVNNMPELNSKLMGDLARAAKQPVTVELNKIGDRKDVGGIIYELDEKGWRKLPIGTTL